MSEPAQLRIGELSRRSGVSPELLRAWERRYGLLDPVRSAGGLRLYSLADLERVRVMQQHLADGLAAAEAAAAAVRAPGAGTQAPTARGSSVSAVDQLAAALEGFDEPGAHAIFDRLLAEVTLDVFLSEIVMPYLRDLGARWERGEVTVAQEHFASNIVRGRLLGIARGWGRGLGPRALLACVPGEQHELGLLAFGLALRTHGWRIEYLGADTPLDTIRRVADSLDVDLVVLSSVTPERVGELVTELRQISRERRLAVGGAGAEGLPTTGLDALALTDDPVREAERVTALLHAD
jgi:MerR family transcriptional regulator, light-induced transcriptional regulator